MQYTSGRVSVTNGSPIVTGTPDVVDFSSNVQAGNAFLVSGDSVVYTVASTGSGETKNTLTLSAPYQGATKSWVPYQVTRDYTPNLGLAEINIGDQDWPVHLTQEVIRKIDTALSRLYVGQGEGKVTTVSGGSTTVTATSPNAFDQLRAGFTITANGVTRTVVSIVDLSTVVVNRPVDWHNGGAGYGYIFGIGPEALRIDSVEFVDNGAVYNLVPSLTGTEVPVSGTPAYVQAEWTIAGTAVIYEAVTPGASGNNITVVHATTSTHPKTPTIVVTVNGTDGTVSIVVTGRNNSTTVDDIATAILLDGAASQYITATVVQSGIVMANYYSFPLTGGTDATPGPVGCLSFAIDPMGNSTIYRKTSAQTWTRFV